MTKIFLVRHGQAGTRDSYDSLSPLGRRQSRLLAEHFLSEEVEFAAVYSGTQSRQTETAAEIRAAYNEAHRSIPDIAAEEGWNEFDLEHVYREIAPLLCAEDPEFQRQYEAMREAMQAAAGAHDAEVHRRWTSCDVDVVKAWVRARYRYSGESWEQFRKRVAGCRFEAYQPHENVNVLVITSATPTAVWTASALDIFDERIMNLAGVLYNASYTVLRQRGPDLRLLMFNVIAHLASPELRTHR